MDLAGGFQTAAHPPTTGIAVALPRSAFAIPFQQASSFPSSSSSSPLIIQPKLQCRVCGTTSGIRSALACDACKKFFLRNREKLNDIFCTTGRGDCAEFTDHRLLEMELVTRRRYCVKCRLKKCFEVGLGTTNKHQNRQFKSNNNHSNENRVPSSSGTQAVTTVSQLFSDETTSLDNTTGKSAFVKVFVPEPPLTALQSCLGEERLESVLQSAVELSAFHATPCARFDLPNPTAAWHKAMEVFDYVVQVGVSFVRALVAATGAIPQSDLNYLFSRALVPNLIVELAQPGMSSGHRFFGFGETMKRSFIHHFPSYKLLADEFDEIGAVMEAWKPTFPETALLQALIFFRDDDISKLSNPELVVQINQQFQMTLDWYLANNENADLRKHYFMRVYKYLIAKMDKDYRSTILRLSNSRPDLTHFNRTFAEIHLGETLDEEPKIERAVAPFTSTTSNCLPAQSTTQPRSVLLSSASGNIDNQHQTKQPPTSITSFMPIYNNNNYNNLRKRPSNFSIDFLLSK